MIKPKNAALERIKSPTSLISSIFLFSHSRIIPLLSRNKFFECSIKESFKSGCSKIRFFIEALSPSLIWIAYVRNFIIENFNNFMLPHGWHIHFILGIVVSNTESVLPRLEYVKILFIQDIFRSFNKKTGDVNWLR